MIIEYAIFFALIGFCLLLFFLSERQYKPRQHTPRDKCESPIERRLYDGLLARGYSPLTQVPCGKYRIDIALVSHKLAIEADGKAFHSSPQQKARDKRRDAFLRNNGWRVMRFSGRQIFRELNSVLDRIEKEISS
ncbi:endonuclease domain-containing protein [Alkalihalophilus pseudofirmus]|uniref:endonuclease domain-containing protein n=1 Tax=Alkalihalophilus pseudofirmus TaxID=79885 RepID=UPI0005A291BD|nr:DUF559 domain-containing protein [Alkalihalophilus pseudofirmus]